ncbi:MAG: hypothetical protein RMJ87_06320 [Cytophagales bacterium]|nr:hypothetical protein [Bernardetiaceae bacterium]MDW8204626.1 hypothetical protein [Cytophagales bacterium]
MKNGWFLGLLLLAGIQQIAAQHVDSIPIYPNNPIPFAKEGHGIVQTMKSLTPDIDLVSGVTSPYLKLFLPALQKNVNPIIIICPGGGYRVLVNKHEGTAVAQWLNSLGIAAAVLHYRLPDARAMEQPAFVPLYDLQQAIRLVRRTLSSYGRSEMGGAKCSPPRFNDAHLSSH